MIGLSLFSGYGGIDLALNEYITEVVAYVEIEEYAQKIIAYRMAEGSLPRAPILADVKNVSGESGDCEIIYGGFPCQDISVAGARKGLDGERSGLFYEIFRLTKEIYPAFVFLENVPGIRTKGLRQIIGAFAGLGYVCRWTRVSAASVGAPHERDRWFLLAHANRELLRVEWERRSKRETSVEEVSKLNGIQWAMANTNRLWKLSKQGQHDGFGDSSQKMANADGARLEGRRRSESTLNRFTEGRGWTAEPNVGRVANGVAFELDFIEEIKIDEKINGKKTESKISNVSKSVLQTMWQNRELAATSPSLYRERFYSCLPNLPQRNPQSRGNMGPWIERDEDLCNMLNEFCSETLEKSQDLQSRLLERLRQIKRDETLEKGFRVDRIKALGNGVVPLQAKTAFEKLMGIK